MKEIEVQLSPFGEFPQTREDGTEVTQICDADAFARLVAAFEPGEIPVDFDHGIESEDGSTRAAAWISRIWVDPEKAAAFLQDGENRHPYPGKIRDKCSQVFSFA